MSAAIPLDDAPSGSRPTAWAASPPGTTGGLRTRRYHALLLAATTPPTGRMVLVNGARRLGRGGATGPAARVPQPPAVRPGRAWRPDGGAMPASRFTDEPWPTWT